MHTFSRSLIVFLFLGTLFVQAPFVYGASDLQVSGWMPYWNDSSAMRDAKKHIDSIDMVYPFAFTMTTKGELRDQAGLGDKDWKNFIKTARNNDVEIIPSIMSSDGVAIHAILSSTSTRTAHIAGILEMVEKGKYDGVDIDYESKKSETKDYFSQFLKELKAGLGKKKLTCTLEARTPPDSLYKEVPAMIAYANDYKEIAKYCDQVELMTYDQQRADLKLNTEKAGEPYMPLSDADWVEKVIVLALKDIPKEKVVLGIPTYGHHYAVTVAPNWYRDYRKIGALNVPDILDVAKEYKVTPSRNRAGEMSFTYLPKSSTVKFPKTLKIPKNTPKGNLVSARALAYANKTGSEVVFNIAWYSDAEAMKQKIDLAKKYDLHGIAFFKIDGEEDQKVWKYVK
jgi:spore germination protein YaaH